MFLQIVGEGSGNRAVQERFQHSGDTVSHVFHEVLEALMILHQKIVLLPNSDTPLADRIAKNSKYFPYFENYIGALDGIHIPAHVPAAEAAPYRNRKGYLSQNVLGVCNLDLEFCYILAGWEGSAHDDRVLEDALFNYDFITPDGKYYLADAGYHNTDYLLCPYRGVRYHLKEQVSAAQKPRTKEELFNLRHSSLRNAVEGIFGVTKRRFQIFNSPPEYTLKIQVQLIFAVTALHNFIRQKASSADLFDLEQQQAEDRERPNSHMGDNNEEEEGLQTDANTSKGDGKKMNAFREEIAKAMWEDYQNY